MNEIIGFGIPLIGSLALALAAVVGFGVLLHAEGHLRRYVVPLVFGITLFAIAAGTIFSGRNVSMAGEDLTELAAASSSISTWLLRLCTLAIVGLCFSRLAASQLRREHSSTPGLGLFVAFCCFFISNSVTNALFGSYPEFIHGIYYVFFVFSAAYLGRDFPPRQTLLVARTGAFLFLLLGCIAAVIKPEIALQNNYVGFLPGIRFRFWGLGSNPNSIGPMAGIAMLTLVLIPFRSKLLNVMALGLAVLVLLLSQSKTAWLAIFVALSVTYLYRIYDRPQTPGQRFDQMLIVWLTACVLGVGLVFIYFLFDVGGWLERLLVTKEGAQIASLTGRSAIWQVAIAAWENNPYFGYGINMWNPLHRFQIGMPFAFSAHNQWLQSLGSAGALGLAGLLVYMALLARYALRAASGTRGVSLGLLIFLLIRCISETPLETDTLLNADTFSHLLTFIVLLTYGPKPMTAQKRIAA